MCTASCVNVCRLMLCTRFDGIISSSELNAVNVRGWRAAAARDITSCTPLIQYRHAAAAVDVFLRISSSSSSTDRCALHFLNVRIEKHVQNLLMGFACWSSRTARLNAVSYWWHSVFHITELQSFQKSTFTISANDIYIHCFNVLPCEYHCLIRFKLSGVS